MDPRSWLRPVQPASSRLQLDFVDAFQSFLEIDRISHRHLAWIDLVCPYLEVSHACGSIDGRKGALDRVETVRDLYAADPGFVVASVKDMPLPAEIHFAVSMKIHRRSGIDMSDVRQVTSDVSRRHV